MIIVIVNREQLKELRKIMSQFLDEARALIEKVAQGNASDPAMKADIASLKEMLTANAAADAENKASDEEVKTLILELLNKLAASSPPEEGTPEAPPEA